MKRYPFLGQRELENFGLFGSSQRGCRKAIHEHDRRLVADRAVRSDLVIVSTPILHFRSRIVKAHEPVGVQALGAELAVEALDESIIGRLAWS